MTDMTRAGMRGKLTEWRRRRRKEQALTDALEAAGLFEQEQIVWLFKTVQSTKDTAEPH